MPCIFVKGVLLTMHTLFLFKKTGNLDLTN